VLNLCSKRYEDEEENKEGEEEVGVAVWFCRAEGLLAESCMYSSSSVFWIKTKCFGRIAISVLGLGTVG